MSEERNKDEEERLKVELKELIDHKIEYFISSPKKKTSLYSLLYFPSWLFAAHGYGAF